MLMHAYDIPVRKPAAHACISAYMLQTPTCIHVATAYMYTCIHASALMRGAAMAVRPHRSTRAHLHRSIRTRTVLNMHGCAGAIMRECACVCVRVYSHAYLHARGGVWVTAYPCISVHICMSACLHVCVPAHHPCLHMRLHSLCVISVCCSRAPLRLRGSKHVALCMSAGIREDLHACMHAWKHACKRECMHACTSVCMSTHARILT